MVERDDNNNHIFNCTFITVRYSVIPFILISSNNAALFSQKILQNVFKIHEDTVNQEIGNKWCELDIDVKQMLIRSTQLELTARGMNGHSAIHITSRLRRFFNQRRSLHLVRQDERKRRRLRKIRKLHQANYVSDEIRQIFSFTRNLDEAQVLKVS